MEENTFIIIDPNSEVGDIELSRLLRKGGYDFFTGLYSGNDGKCIWYLTDKENFDDARKPCYGGGFLMCKYKLMQSNHFECNCADVDLPMIEDVMHYLRF